MTNAFNEAVQALKSKLVRDGISSDVYNAYIGLICKAARRNHPDKSYTGPESNEAHNITKLKTNWDQYQFFVVFYTGSGHIYSNEKNYYELNPKRNPTLERKTQ
jgi:hypothetical protein